MDFGKGLSFSIVPTVYKREDYKQTKHDAVFSNWKVLIGSEDWEDFKKGKDGVGRYRVQNLPRRSCPGLYELGVAVISHDDQKARKLDSDDVLAAYLGQAESVRSRLQCYGRSGAHLRNANNNLDGCDSPPDNKAVTAGLFEDIFMKGGSVVYRWAPMGSKREAEATEGMLLSTFDYAWNKGSNGERRQLDLLKKLGDLEFIRNRESGVSHVELFPFLRNQVGNEEERKLSCDVVGEERESSNFLTSIIKVSRSRPQPVSDKSDEIFSGSSSCSDSSVCGVVLENGDCCSASPVKGRKRCIEHKGQRICRVSPVKQQSERQDYKHQDTDVTTCGVILPNMEPCNKKPVPGRKRCEDHKGMRINAFLFLLNRTDREKTVKEEEEEVASPRFCEATTKNGVPCTRSSPRGSKRCWQHKEKENIHPVVAGTQVRCGVKVCDGVVCERSPVKGRKRCEEHKGMRVIIIPS
ncbi:hypothetical protein Bca52824_049975 [Brassica carinata]|uniref:Protein EFFECTOR OF TRANSCRIPTION 2-like n=1 Tax=Brassica carinata TaxID=52824 RepID=A0A8X7UUN1_BRACI|nr:hypothetical protein Bca52824_049975 [Brassica carinata]